MKPLLLRWLSLTLGILGLLYLLLLIPLPESQVPPAPKSGRHHPFAWNQDAYWDGLEDRYAHARTAGPDAILPAVNAGFDQLRRVLTRLEREHLDPVSPVFAEAEQIVFQIAPWIATCTYELPIFMDLCARLRSAVKHQSERWRMDDPVARETLYRVLYGIRGAVEELILLVPLKAVPAAMTAGTKERSATPSASLLGLEVHSGDVLLSRGGAPTSALIARGNDFPGNFSHVALAFVDPKTHVLKIIESHIERGLSISTPEEYFRDTKLRVMVLRLRADLPAMRSDPMLPHKAALSGLERALGPHVPYDFSMDYQDTTKMFCSEVVSHAYRRQGVKLWMGLSYVSGNGLRQWLAGLGVRHFETEEPSDLEYDPQLRVVAEWRDTETLRRDHFDNAVTEAMLDAAAKGAELRYDWYLLPVGRFLKAYSVALNWIGGVGPIPEGMSATAALRNQWYSELHTSLRAVVESKAEAYRVSHGYFAPYWRLVRMAHDAVQQSGELDAQ